jgi:transcription elongation factor Elf1
MEVTTFVVRKIEWLNYLPKVIRATNMITREHMVKLDEKFTCVLCDFAGTAETLVDDQLQR